MQQMVLARIVQVRVIKVHPTRRNTWRLDRLVAADPRRRRFDLLPARRRSQPRRMERGAASSFLSAKERQKVFHYQNSGQVSDGRDSHQR